MIEGFILTENKKDFIEGTVCWILKDGKALLQLKTRGISEGKWNAAGGHVEKGETPFECVKREVFEETGLTIGEPTYHGKFKFFFGEGSEENKKSLTTPWIIHVFSTDKFAGELKESDEGELRWFEIDKIPFDKMWQDDALWVPLVLEGKRFDGEFVFNEDGKQLIKHELRVDG